MEILKIPITEDQPKINKCLRPIETYDENVLEWFSRLNKIRYVALRYFNTAGAYYDGSIGEAHDPETHLIPIVLQTALGKREKVYIYETIIRQRMELLLETIYMSWI